MQKLQKKEYSLWRNFKLFALDCPSSVFVVNWKQIFSFSHLTANLQPCLLQARCQLPRGADSQRLSDLSTTPQSLVNCPTRWSLSFIFVFLCWSSIFPIPDTKKYSTAECYFITPLYLYDYHCETQLFADQKLSSSIFTCCPSRPASVTSAFMPIYIDFEHWCQYL